MREDTRKSTRGKTRTVVADQSTERAPSWKNKWKDTQNSVSLSIIYGVKEKISIYFFSSPNKKSSLSLYLKLSPYVMAIHPIADIFNLSSGMRGTSPTSLACMVWACWSTQAANIKASSDV